MSVSVFSLNVVVVGVVVGVAVVVAAVAAATTADAVVNNASVFLYFFLISNR